MKSSFCFSAARQWATPLRREKIQRMASQHPRLQTHAAEKQKENLVDSQPSINRPPLWGLKNGQLIGIWSLKFLWSLGFGVWSFIAASLASAQCAEITRSQTNQPIPLIRAHAHNDYEHKHPLFDALDHGFCSVEADIYLMDGKLLVAHNLSQVKPERTLQALYLDPLRERVRKNGGRVYANGPECTLLIDLKSEWRRIYPALRDVLKEYSDILSTFRSDTKETNAITAIITGNRFWCG